MGMTQEKLNKALELHRKWLDDDPEGKRLSLRGANLSNADLHDADLHYADLHGTSLRGANLYSANLRGVNLRDANLRGAKLCWVNWHETIGIDVYIAGMQSSRHNAQLVYIPSLDVATTGCWQGSWKDTKERVDKVYKNENISIYKKYQLAFKYIEEQMEADE